MFKSMMLAVMFCLAVGALEAADLSGEFTFDRRAPVVGLVYFSEDTSAEPGTISVDQVGKEFQKSIVVGPKGTQVVFKNSDAVQHNVFADDKNQGIAFDSDLVDPGGEASQTIDWDDQKVVRVGCKIHPKMQIYIGSISSKFYAAVTFEKQTTKSISISGVPDNLTKVTIWIPRYDPMEATVAPGGSATVDITRKGKSYGKLTLTR